MSDNNNIDSIDLLFFDTFLHDNSEELNLDLVKFKKAVVIHEVRVIPLGTRVGIDVSGGARMGATNPSSFKLELFVNNLIEPKAATFEKLGLLEYKENVDIQLKTEKKVTTDGLVIKGWYQTITLAVYGCTVQISKESSPPPPPPAKPKIQAPIETHSIIAQYEQSMDHSVPATIAPIITSPRPLHSPKHNDPHDRDESNDFHIRYERKSPEYGRDGNDRQRRQEELGKDFSDDDDLYGGEEKNREEKRRRTNTGSKEEKSTSLGKSELHFSPDSIDYMEDEEPGEIPDKDVDPVDILYGALSDGEIAEGEAEYSQDSVENSHFNYNQEGGDMWETAEDGYGSISSFNPYQCDLAPLETFRDPSLTMYEWEKRRMRLRKSESTRHIPPAAHQIIKIIDQYKHSSHTDRWVEAMESVVNYIVPGLVYIVNKMDNKQDILDKLIEWAMEGLDLNKALAQPEVAYKIRHLKMGIRLAGCLCSCDSFIAFKILSREVQHRLLDLFCSSNMSSAMKVQICLALDESTRLKEGLDWMLGRHSVQLLSDSNKLDDQASTRASDTAPSTENEATPTSTKQMTAYQRILQILLEKQPSHVMPSLAALLRKVHLYESLLKMNTSIANLIDGMAKMVQSKEGTLMGEDEMVPDMIESQDLEAVFETDLSVIIQCLEEVRNILTSPDMLIGQPRRSYPTSVRFDIFKKPHNPVPNLYHILNSCRLLEGLFVLLSCSSTCNHSGIFSAVKNVLTAFILSQSGLLFLNHRVNVVNNILRSLLLSQDYPQEEERDLNPCNQLGLTLVYHLQTIQHIDQLNEFHGKVATGEKEPDESQMLAVLHNLYLMTFTVQGRDALVYVLSLDDNIATFIPFIEGIVGSYDPEGKQNRSVCFVYVATILLVVARFATKVEWLERFGTRILLAADAESRNGRPDERLTELVDWLSPLKSVSSFTYDSATVQALVVLLKQHAEEIRDYPKAIITVLRIFRHLAIPQSSQEDNNENGVKLLKHQFILAEMFSADCLSIFINILSKIKEQLQLSWQQGFPQTTTERSLIFSLIQPVLQLMKTLLSFQVMARGSEFKDLSMLPSIFGIHTIFCSVSHTGLLANDAQSIQNDIVDILMCLTNVQLKEEDNEEALSKCIWSQMIKEVLKYTLTAPYTFLSGLVLISELLPLPLPVQSKDFLTSREVEEVVETRKRWSGYLLTANQEIQNIIRNLSGTSCQPLHQLLRRVCWQLADLASPTALCIIRSLLDTLLESLDNSKIAKFGELDNEAAEAHLEVSSSSITSKILNLFSFLMNQPAVKAAYLFLFKSGIKTDEKYNDVPLRLSLLLNIIHDNQSHLQAQESIVSIFQSLCDVEISLLIAENSNSPMEQLANGLPPKDQLSLICNSLVAHIDNRDQKFSSVLPSLRTLTLLMDHDIGFYYVKQAMSKTPTAFFNLFMQINATFSKDSSDCIATLSSAAECIQFLVALPSPPTPKEEKPERNGIKDEEIDPKEQPSSLGPCPRTCTMSFKEVRELLGWSTEEAVLAHPLNDLDNLLCEYAKDEETLKAVYESVSAVVGVLRSDEIQPERPEMLEPELPAAESLNIQFNRRIIYIVTNEEDDRLTTAYWLSTPMVEETDHDQDLVKCNLIEMAANYCTSFDLEAELKKGTTVSDVALVPKTRKRLSTRRSTDTINTSKMRSGFVAPLRGRGFNRGAPNTGRGDLFRSRPPNTSRPPSMHVDDFVKMEVHPQPIGLPIPQPEVIRTQMFDRGGMRGGSSFMQTKWRFSTMPSAYTHRDDMSRGGYRGSIGVLGSRSLMRGTATGSTIGRTSPSKWVGRTMRSGYTPSTFNRDAVMMNAVDRMDRRRELTGPTYYMHGNWAEQKDRPEQRFIAAPSENFAFYRERERHQRTTR